MVASPFLIAISIVGIISSHIYDSYRSVEGFFKALTCLWVHNIWRSHVYAPKPHLTFSGYDESLMMTSIGFHIFGPQINKVVRGVGQRLSRGVCQYVCVSMYACVCVSLSMPSSSRTGGKMPVLIGGRARALSPMQHSGAGRIADGFPSFFQAIPACQAVGVPSIIDHIQGWKAETLSGDWASLAPRRKKKKKQGKETQPGLPTLCERRRENIFFKSYWTVTENQTVWKVNTVLHQ